MYYYILCMLYYYVCYKTYIKTCCQSMIFLKKCFHFLNALNLVGTERDCVSRALGREENQAKKKVI